jgi:hypothetical protein
VLALVGGEHLAALSYLGVEVIAQPSWSVPTQPRLEPGGRPAPELTKVHKLYKWFIGLGIISK